MFSLTPRERKIFVFLGILIFCGAILRFLSVKINNVNVITDNKNQIQEVFPININNANLLDLEKIPGVGPEIANRIIEYRTNHGQFIRLDNLKEVKGIGDKKFEAMKDCITLRDN
ncbi:MAG: helix-hairpin-helix domain-containing protein [Candidatus Omnitrophica bacterium]|nr:helix-hairpin-helix domain-containing protein [Candidatus Omnitrophota bacterium]